MDRITKYRSKIESLITDYSKYGSSDPDVATQLIFDRERNHYQLVNTGWKGLKRIHGCVLHLDIKNGKIWIQQDFTEEGVADKLVKLGVPKVYPLSGR